MILDGSFPEITIVDLLVNLAGLLSIITVSYLAYYKGNTPLNVCATRRSVSSLNPYAIAQGADIWLSITFHKNQDAALFLIKPCTPNSVTIFGNLFIDHHASRVAIKDGEMARLLDYTNKSIFKYETVRTLRLRDRNKLSIDGGKYINSVNIPEQIRLSVQTPHFMSYN